MVDNVQPCKGVTIHDMGHKLHNVTTAAACYFWLLLQDS
jgi:hypothetical protein